MVIKMYTDNYCDQCKTWRRFWKEGKNERKNIPWKCVSCGWEIMDFPHQSLYKWVMTGRRPKWTKKQKDGH